MDDADDVAFGEESRDAAVSVHDGKAANVVGDQQVNRRIQRVVRLNGDNGGGFVPE